MDPAGMLRVVAKGDHEIVMTCTFEAPRALVFDAWTKPELLTRWLLGPDGWVFAACDVDLRVGGSYRYVWRKLSTGTLMGMRGAYREVAKPDRIVATEQFDEPWYPGEATNTLVLDEQAGMTTATTTMHYDTEVARDGVLQSGMESGVAASYDRLVELLASSPAR